MSNRTTVEFNHDYAPGDNDAELLAWASKLRMFLHSGDKDFLPKGITFIESRHHSDSSIVERLEKQTEITRQWVELFGTVRLDQPHSANYRSQ